MKTKIIICIAIAVALVTVAWTVPSNDRGQVGVKKAKTVEPVFNFMHAHRQGRGATVAWNSNSTPAEVICFEVMRTYEDPNDPYSQWDQVGNYACSSNPSYKCTENNVSPGFVSYCVIASMVGGGTVMSEIETIHIVQH